MAKRDKIRFIDGDETELLTREHNGARRHRPGVRRKVKDQHNRRVRRNQKRAWLDSEGE